MKFGIYALVSTALLVSTGAQLYIQHESFYPTMVALTQEKVPLAVGSEAASLRVAEQWVAEEDKMMVVSAPYSRMDRSTNRFVLWTEWPSFDSTSDWVDYFTRLIDFITSDCSTLGVGRVVLRVLSPEFQSRRGLLWQVTPDSVLYRHFLSLVPPGIEIYIYPYLLEKSVTSQWTSSTDASAPLEGVFKYVAAWNRLLSGSGVSIGGIVTDYEEGRGFRGELGNLGEYRRVYGEGIRFGTTLGFDSVGSISSYLKKFQIDEFYLEMYDFYRHGIKTVSTVQPGHFPNQPHQLLAALDQSVWARYTKLYNQHADRIVFMWSLQNKNSSACHFPLPDGTCGERADFGAWDQSAFLNFLKLVEDKRPYMAGRHGMFQFNYLPTGWENSC